MSWKRGSQVPIGMDDMPPANFPGPGFVRQEKMYTTVNAPKPVCWRVPGARVEKCDWAGRTKRGTIELPLGVHLQILAITARVKNLEWLAYLIGSVADETYTVTDIVVPKQLVTAGSVVVTEPRGDNGIIGTVHLHPFGGKPGFSGTDDTYIGGNHKCMLVCNNQGDYAAKTREGLPCGSSILADADFQIVLPAPEKIAAFVDAALVNIEEEHYVVPAYAGYQQPAIGPVVVSKDKVDRDWQGKFPVEDYAGPAPCLKCKQPIEQHLKSWNAGQGDLDVICPRDIDRWKAENATSRAEVYAEVAKREGGDDKTINCGWCHTLINLTLLARYVNNVRVCEKCWKDDRTVFGPTP